MAHSQSLLRAPARSGLGFLRPVTCLAALAIALTAGIMAPGIARANQTYPEAVRAGSPITLGTPPAALPRGKRYLTRKTVEQIAKGDIGKLQGLRIGPFAPGASSKALPLGQAEGLIGHPFASGANPATPAWVVTVDAPPKDDILGERTTAKVFTDVIDAVSGSVLDSCDGCRSVR
jgi:hypothetical protein